MIYEKSILINMITFATLPKPFVGHIGIIQRNAIQSWLQIHPKPEIILFGNEEGVADIADEFQLKHISELQCNEHGTPFLNDVFQKFESQASNNLLCYVNCDIILFQDIITSLEKAMKSFEKFLLVGECQNLDVRNPINYQDAVWEVILKARMDAEGIRRGSNADYFVFKKGMFEFPPLILGRPYFDNWILWEARQLNIPFIDATGMTSAVHQNHYYSHVPGETTVRHKGDEAFENLKILGGKAHVYWISDSTHRIARNGIKRNWIGTLLLWQRAVKLRWICRRTLAILLGPVLRVIRKKK